MRYIEMHTTIESIREAGAIILCGISGSGKTVLSRQLEKIGFSRISVDEMIWNEYGSGFYDLPFARQQPVFRLMHERMEEEAKRLLDKGCRIVVDSTMCKREKRDSIRQICRDRGVEPVIVFLKAPFDLLEKRLEGRNGTGPDDLIMEKQQLSSFFANFEVPGEDENPIIIDQTTL